MIGRLIIAVHHHRRHCHFGSSSSLSMLFLFQFLLLFCCLKGYEHQPFLMFLHNWFDSSTAERTSACHLFRSSQTAASPPTATGTTCGSWAAAPSWQANGRGRSPSSRRIPTAARASASTAEGPSYILRGSSRLHTA